MFIFLAFYNNQHIEIANNRRGKQEIKMFHIFQKQYHRYLRIDQQLDPKLSPLKLMKQLHNSQSNRKQFVKCMTKKTKNGFKILRRLSVAHILLMNSKKLTKQILQFIQNPLQSSNEWLNINCINPYYRFLHKIVASFELYTCIKQSTSKDANFQYIFYIVNLFTEMFKIAGKMPFLGRYFKESCESTVTAFVNTLAVQAQKLYTHLKSAVIQMLNHPKLYLKCKEDQVLLKAVLEQSIIEINQQMKKLFLDKYFYPYEKGIWVKLFRPDQQPKETLKVIKGILSNHQQTQRNNAHRQLQQTLFPEGGVNLQFYELTLRPCQKQNEVTAEEEILDEPIDECFKVDFGEQSTATIYSTACQESNVNVQICQDI